MGKTIIIEYFGSLYNDMLDWLKMEQLNERISNLDGIYVMLVVNIIRIIMLLYH